VLGDVQLAKTDVFGTIENHIPAGTGLLDDECDLYR